MDFQSSTVAVRALQELVESSAVGIDHVENIDIVYNGGGWVEASVRVLARNLSIRPQMKRVRAGGEAKLRIESQQRDAATVAGVVRVAHAQVELVFASDKKCLAYYFDSCEIASGTDASGGCVHLVVPVPADATLGSELVVRRVSVASCDVDLGEALVRFIVGFNNVPACTGRVYTAARDGDIAALVQALDDGCSTQEADGVSAAKYLRFIQAFTAGGLWACFIGGVRRFKSYLCLRNSENDRMPPVDLVLHP
jgi:hypothetical protein